MQAAGVATAHGYFDTWFSSTKILAWTTDVQHPLICCRGYYVVDEETIMGHSRHFCITSIMNGDRRPEEQIVAMSEPL
jgi:hypothetical protein